MPPWPVTPFILQFEQSCFQSGSIEIPTVFHFQSPSFCGITLGRRGSVAGRVPHWSFAPSGSIYLGIPMRSKDEVFRLDSLAQAQVHSSTIRWTLANCSSMAFFICFQRCLLLWVHRLAPFQTFTLPGAMLKGKFRPKRSGSNCKGRD